MTTGTIADGSIVTYGEYATTPTGKAVLSLIKIMLDNAKGDTTDLYRTFDQMIGGAEIEAGQSGMQHIITDITDELGTADWHGDAAGTRHRPTILVSELIKALDTILQRHTTPDE